MSAALTMPLPCDVGADRLAEAAAHAERDGERVMLTRDGKPVAAVVPIEDVAALEAWEDEQDAHAAEEAIARWEAEGRPMGATLEELAVRWGVTLDPDAA
ncbi:MAG: type II toxin-antitoxin system Phd/YefM family antitoxin [Proteobacteria bacterium]|nr:type II toxin-antitoxin system Phd/YefM family antitoxin [Pseudomonadota bacterium]